MLSAKNIQNNKLIITSEDRHISNEDFNYINKYFEPMKNDVLLTIVGTVGRVASLSETPSNIAFQRSVAFLRPNSKYLSSCFFKNLLLTSNFQNNLKRNQVVSAQPGIYLNDLSNISLWISNEIKEQENISNVLDKINNILTLLQKELELKKALEQYLRKYLLTIFKNNVPILRLKNYKYSWKNKPLKEVANIKTGSRNHQDSIPNGKYPFFVRSANIEHLNEYDFDEKAILVPGDGKIGEIFHYYEGKFALHQRVYKIDKFKEIDPKFLLNLFKNGFKKHSIRLNAQGTVPSLRLPMFTIGIFICLLYLNKNK